MPSAGGKSTALWLQQEGFRSARCPHTAVAKSHALRPQNAVLSHSPSPPRRGQEAAAWQGRMGALPMERMRLQVPLLARGLHCGSVGACGGCEIKTDVKPNFCPPALRPLTASEPTEHCPPWPRQRLSACPEAL